MHNDIRTEHEPALPIGRPLDALLPSAGAMSALVLMLFVLVVFV